MSGFDHPLCNFILPECFLEIVVLRAFTVSMKTQCTPDIEVDMLGVLFASGSDAR